MYSYSKLNEKLLHVNCTAGKGQIDSLWIRLANLQSKSVRKLILINLMPNMKQCTLIGNKVHLWNNEKWKVAQY